MVVQMSTKSATAALKTSDRLVVEGMERRKQLVKTVVALEIYVGYWKRIGEGGEVVIDAIRPPTSSRAWGFYCSSHVDMRQGSETKNTGVEPLSLSGVTKLVNDYATTQISWKALSIAVHIHPPLLGDPRYISCISNICIPLTLSRNARKE